MSLENYSGSERRRYFRVTDLVSLSVRAMSMGEVDIQDDRSKNKASILADLNENLAAQIERVRHQSPEVAKLIELVDSKINFAMNNDESEATDSVETVEVNLSACGIAFLNDSAFAVNQHLALGMTLYPSHTQLALTAAVIHCEREGASFLVRANFVELSDVQQELLVQHVIKRQTQQIQSAKEER